MRCLETEKARIEIQLSIESRLDVFRSTESVLFALEGHIGMRQTPVRERRHHLFGLTRGHDPILEPLKEDDRTGEAIHMMNRRAGPVAIDRLRQRPHQPIRIAGLEFVGVTCEGLEIPDAVVTRARGEGLCKRERT